MNRKQRIDIIGEGEDLFFFSNDKFLKVMVYSKNQANFNITSPLVCTMKYFKT